MTDEEPEPILNDLRDLVDSTIEDIRSDGVGVDYRDGINAGRSRMVRHIEEIIEEYEEADDDDR